MKKIAIIAAGGSGSRMNATVPKQFLLLNNKPILYYTINTFFESYADIKIILVLQKEFIDKGKELAETFFHDKQIEIIAGGSTRFYSVQKGLQSIKEEAIVFVHDGIRCLVNKELIHRCYEAALEFGSAIPVIDAKESLRILKDNGSEALERSMIKIVQTPQVFKSSILLSAYKTDYKDGFTDEASVIEATGQKIHLVKGDEHNIKITHPIDLIMAEEFLKSLMLKSTD